MDGLYVFGREGGYGRQDTEVEGGSRLVKMVHGVVLAFFFLVCTCIGMVLAAVACLVTFLNEDYEFFWSFDLLYIINVFFFGGEGGWR